MDDWVFFVGFVNCLYMLIEECLDVGFLTKNTLCALEQSCTHDELASS